MPDNFPPLGISMNNYLWAALALVYLMSIAIMARRALEVSKDPWMKPKWYEVIGLTIVGLCPVINTIGAAILIRSWKAGKI
jgi:hypothetical protein